MEKKSIIIGNKKFTLKIADNFLSRLKGLLGKSEMIDDEALLITPCNSIHTIGMQFNITVIFLNKKNQVVRVINNVSPFKCFFCFSANKVIEISYKNNEKLNIKKNDYILLEK